MIIAAITYALGVVILRKMNDLSFDVAVFWY